MGERIKASKEVEESGRRWMGRRRKDKDVKGSGGVGEEEDGKKEEG